MSEFFSQFILQGSVITVVGIVMTVNGIMSAKQLMKDITGDVIKKSRFTTGIFVVLFILFSIFTEFIVVGIKDSGDPVDCIWIGMVVMVPFVLFNGGFALYYLNYRIILLDDKMIYRNMFRRVRTYDYSEITEIVDNNNGTLLVYSGKKVIMKMEKNELPFSYYERVQQYNIPCRNKNNETVDEHVVRYSWVIIIIMWIPTIPLLIVVILGITSSVPVLYNIIMFIFFFGSLLIDINLVSKKIVVSNNEIIYKEFPRKKRNIKIRNITRITEKEETNNGMATINYKVFYDKKKYFRFGKYDKCADLFIEKMHKENVTFETEK